MTERPRLAASSATTAGLDIEAVATTRRSPIVDPGGLTFVYRGDADAVNLRLWIHGLPASQPFERVGETDLWVLRVELPGNSRVEYKLEVVRDGREEWIIDPLNPLQAADPFGANSVAQGHGYARPEWTLRDEHARPGTLDELTVHSAALGDERHVGVYVPARFRRTRHYPLLIVHDGFDYLRYADLRFVLDNLIHRLEIPPLIAALTQSPDRLEEYAGHDGHARFVAREIPELLQHSFPLHPSPAARGLMGASFGAVASLHAAWRHPGAFGRLVLQSGSFAFSDIGHHRRSATFDPVARFVNEFRTRPGRPAERMYLSCGIYESLIYENRSLVPLLRHHGIEVRYEEVRDGHNWENWRDRLQSALTWLFPGPLWMIYE
ncbi:MAG: enterochelin esterase [Gammaproteobacteria bacterium]|nr:enterochelin esterase [Gammaproteobacteria bacterium]